MSSRETEQEYEAIRKNMEKVRQRIRYACDQADRAHETVRIMMMTKAVPAESVRQVLDMGEDLIGEKNGAELKDKLEELGDDRPEVHFMGSLLQGKMEDLITRVDCVQTLDRYDIACEMNDCLRNAGRELDVLIQVNTSFRKNRDGIIPEHSIRLVLQVARLPFLRIRGLMTRGPEEKHPEKSKNAYRLLKNLSQEIEMLEIPGVDMEILSMGTDHDYKWAIKEGATMIQLGSSIFGMEEDPDPFYWDEDDF